MPLTGTGVQVLLMLSNILNFDVVVSAEAGVMDMCLFVVQLHPESSLPLAASLSVCDPSSGQT